MLRAVLNKSWRQHPTRHQLYRHLPPITKTIQVRRARHAGHCWRSKDKLISDVLLWTPTYGHAKAGQPARTYIQQLCEDTGCNSEDLPEAINDREKWRERVSDIRAGGTTWWWWNWVNTKTRLTAFTFILNILTVTMHVFSVQDVNMFFSLHYLHIWLYFTSLSGSFLCLALFNPRRCKLRVKNISKLKVYFWR